MKYKTITKYIDAVKYDGTNDDEVCRFVAGFGKFDSKLTDLNSIIINQCGESIEVYPHEYLIRNNRGMFEVESENYFEAQWEEVK